MLPFTTVNAITTYYSDYRDYKLGTEEVLDASDTLKKEKYKVYNTKVTNIEDQGYVNENTCSIKYPNDTKTTYSVRARSNIDNRWYTSINIPDGIINKVLLYNSTYSRIYEIQIFDGNNQVDAYINPTDDSLNMLVDKNNETKRRLVPNENIVFYFPKMNARNFRLNTISEDKINGLLYFYYEDGSSVVRKIYGNEVDVVSESYLNEIKPIVGTFDGNDQVNSYEKDSFTLYHCYKENTYVTNIYKKEITNENETLILDDYKTLYNYYIRDKVKISDKKITTNNITLKELVTSSTIDLDNIKIEGEVDYTKNGTYHIKYIFRDDFIVEKDIVINIAKNDKVTTTTTTKPSTTTTTKSSKTTTKSAVKKTTEKTTTTSKKNKTTTTTAKNTTTTKKVENTTTTKLVNTIKKVKTTTKNIKPNDTCPTYNTYDEEVINVEPLKGVIKEQVDNTKDTKPEVKIILIILIILSSLLLIVMVIKEYRKRNLLK